VFKIILRLGKMAKEEVKKREVSVAPDDAKVYHPVLGEVTVAEVKEWLAKQKEAIRKAGLERTKMMREVLRRIMELDTFKKLGAFRASEYSEVLAKVKAERKSKVGVSLGALRKEGFVDRYPKVEGFPYMYFITPKGKEFAMQEEAVTVTEEAKPKAVEEAKEAEVAPEEVEKVIKELEG